MQPSRTVLLLGAILTRLGVGHLMRDGLGRVLARGAATSFVISIGGAGVGFVLQFLLARVLGPSQFGIYVYVLGWMNIALIVAKFDFDNAAVRFVGAYNASGAWGAFAGYLRRTGQVVLAFAVALSAVAATSIWLLRDRASPDVMLTALAACLLLPLTAAHQLRACALQGLKRIRDAQFPVAILRPLLLAVALLAMVLLGSTPTAAGAILLNVGATVVALTITSRLLWRAVPAATRTAAPAFHTRQWFSVAGAMFVISIANIVLTMQTDIVIVGSLLGTTAAGHYSIASQMSWMAIFGVSGVLAMASPMFAELHAQDRRADLQRLVRLASRMTTLVALPAVVVIVLAGRFILRLFGESFVDAYGVLILLCLAQLVGALWGAVAGFVMTMTGHQKPAAVITTVTAAAFLALAFVLTPLFGAVGTAGATLISYTARSVAMWLYIRRTMGIEVLPFGRVHAVAPAPTAP